MSGTANLGNNPNGSIRLGGNSAYTTNYIYDDVTVAQNGFPGTTGVTVTSPGNQTAAAGTPASFNLGSFSDSTAGASSWTVTVSWGDGTANTVFTTGSQGSLGSQTHTYAQGGTFNVTVTVADNQNVSGSTSFQVSVSPSQSGLINFVNFETGDFSQTANHLNGAITSNPALDGNFSLQLFRSGSVAWAEIRQSGMTYYNLPTAFYSFLFRFISQSGEGGIVNFQDGSSNYKAALHLNTAGKLVFFDINGTPLAVGTTTLNPNQTYTISAEIGTGTNAPFIIRINGVVEMSGSGNLGVNNNGSILLGGKSPYTTNYIYDDVAINSQNFPEPPPPGGAGAPSLVLQTQPGGNIATGATPTSHANGGATPIMLSPPSVLGPSGQEQDVATVHGTELAAVDSVFADWKNVL
jgi:PKD domain